MLYFPYFEMLPNTLQAFCVFLAVLMMAGSITARDFGWRSPLLPGNVCSGTVRDAMAVAGASTMGIR